MQHDYKAAGDTRPFKKRLILLLDGTWNDAAFGDTDTNIVRLQEIIAKTLSAQDDAKGGAEAGTGVARPLNDAQNVDNLVFYQRGVGTGWRDKYTGGIFGEGLAGKIRSAYKFLSFHYEPGAEIFIFGFSRGAYTARSLVGYLAAAGLLTRENCTPENERKAWNFYRQPPGQRLPGVWSQLQPLMHPLKDFQIDCLGVFDTVGALGIPLARFKLFNRDDFEFHDVDLSSIVKLSLHAVSLDEQRNPFEATLWRHPKFKRFNSTTEQVWFTGVHCDVGGGYIPEVERIQNAPQALDDIALDWMLKRVLAKYKDFPADQAFWPQTNAAWSKATQHDSLTPLYRLMRRTIRSIGNYPLREKGFYKYNGCYDRHAVAMCEKVHVSALQRLGEEVGRDDSKFRYLPPNLIAALPVIRTTYGDKSAPALSGVEVPVVDWSGESFDANKPADCQTVLDLITAAEGRIKTKRSLLSYLFR